MQTQRKKFLQENTTLFEFACSVPPLAPITQRTPHLEGNDNYYHVMWHGYDMWRRRRYDVIKRNKSVVPYDQESIADYVGKVQPVSEYGFGTEDVVWARRNMNFMVDKHREQEARERAQQEALEAEETQRRERARLEQEKLDRYTRSQLMLYADYCVVSSMRVYLRIVYNQLLDQLFLTAFLESGQQSPQKQLSNGDAAS